MGMDSIVLECEERATAGQSSKEIAEKLSVSVAVVNRILHEGNYLETHDGPYTSSDQE